MWLGQIAVAVRGSRDAHETGPVRLFGRPFSPSSHPKLLKATAGRYMRAHGGQAVGSELQQATGCSGHAGKGAVAGTKAAPTISCSTQHMGVAQGSVCEGIWRWCTHGSWGRTCRWTQPGQRTPGHRQSQRHQPVMGRKREVDMVMVAQWGWGRGSLLGVQGEEDVFAFAGHCAWEDMGRRGPPAQPRLCTHSPSSCLPQPQSQPWRGKLQGSWGGWAPVQQVCAPPSPTPESSQ